MPTIKNGPGDNVTINRDGSSVEGVVTDKSGLAVSGARVLVINTRTKKQVIVKTNTSGEYTASIDAQAGDKILVHVEFKRPGATNIVIIKGVVTLAEDKDELDLVDEKEALSIIEPFEKEIEQLLAEFNALIKDEKTEAA